MSKAVHLLSVRVDALDRRLVQLEAAERRISEFTDTNQRLVDLSNLQQRLARVEETLTLSSCGDGTVTVLGTEADHTGDAGDVVNTTDALMKQLNNLTARMTLAENQLMLQVPLAY